jgi:hypothetical protein
MNCVENVLEANSDQKPSHPEHPLPRRSLHIAYQELAASHG